MYFFERSLHDSIGSRPTSCLLESIAISAHFRDQRNAKLAISRRSGRAGRKGLSVVLLQPGREEDYISFLEVRKTPISPLDSPEINITDEDARAAAKKIRQVVLADRALNDKAKRGFVSWVRSYSKHQASSIFRLSDLDWEDLGNTWGLLKLPEMPELKNWEGDRSLGVDVDWNNYAYKDKKKEDVRKRTLAEKQSTEEEESVTANAGDPPPPSPWPEKKQPKRPWSNKLDAKDERELRRNKKRTKREHDKWEKMTPVEREKQRELERMIEEIRKGNVGAERFGSPFEGFD